MDHATDIFDLVSAMKTAGEPFATASPSCVPTPSPVCSAGHCSTST